MIRNHHTLSALAAELSTILEGARLSDAWSSSKGIAIMQFTTTEGEVGIECDLRNDYGSVLPRTQLHKPHRNCRELFAQAFGESLALVTKHPTDRIITLWLNSYQIHVELFSANSGNIILVKDGVVVDSLHDRSRRVSQQFIVNEHAHHNVSGDDSVRKYLAKTYHHLGSVLCNEILLRVGVDPSALYTTMQSAIHDQIHQCAHTIVKEIEASNTWYILDAASSVTLSPIRLRNADIIQECSSVIDAITSTIRLRDQRSRFSRQRKSLQQAVGSRLKKVRRTLEHLHADEENDVREQSYKHYADLLMSQSEPHRSGLTSVTIDSYDTNEVVTIPLQEDLSIIENATRLYDKARSAAAAAVARRKRIPALGTELQQLEALENAITSASNMSDLPQLPNNVKPIDADVHKRTPESKYRVFVIDSEHTLYVGKSAASNDELTMKFARQQDWWLHVRGASGSHAVLRGVTASKIPKTVLEVAAGITAYYSQARNASYVPVVYTQRKYVRKPKGANVGAVTLEREQTVMVKPMLPEAYASME